MQIDTIDDSVVLSEEKWNYYLEQNIVALFRGTRFSFNINQNKILMQCNIRFSRDTIDSFRVVPLFMVIDIKNRSSIPIISMELSIPLDKGFILSSEKQIELYQVDPSPNSPSSTSSISWQNLGSRYSLNKENIKYSPENPDPNKNHQILVHLSHETIGVEKTVRILVPILCWKVPLGLFKTKINFLIKSDTKPSQLNLETDSFEIPIVHIRKKIIKGKEVCALDKAQSYQIGIFLENQGDNPLDNVIIQDNLPKNFTFETFQPEPYKIYQFSTFYRVIWFIQCVSKGEKCQITYSISGKGAYKASDSQFFV